MKLHIQTPLLQSQQLKNQWGKTVYFKLEALQPTGSFKIRGIGYLCQKLALEGASSFVASSGGNAGIAVAYAGMKLNKPTTIFIPKSSNPIYINAIESFGATVIVAGETAGDAQTSAMEFSKTHAVPYIHPYDNPDIWHGHSTLIDEIAALGIKPDAVIVSVGGGGLACGVLEGMHRHGWSNTPFFAVETIGADVFAQSIRAKASIKLTKITSKATSLGATYAAPKLLEWAKKHPITNIVMDDAQAEAGSRAFAQDKRVLVELASGASLSMVYENNPALFNYESILVMVCGGINVSHFSI